MSTVEVIVREPEPRREDDYRYVAECAPAHIRSAVILSAGDDREPAAALDKLFAGLKELGVVASFDQVNVQDETGDIGEGAN